MDRESHRAAVEAGYANLKDYIDKWGEELMDYRVIARAISDPNEPHEFTDHDLATFFLIAANEVERMRLDMTMVLRNLKEYQELAEDNENLRDHVKKLINTIRKIKKEGV